MEGTIDRAIEDVFERPRRVVFHYTARPFGVMAMEGWPGYTLVPVPMNLGYGMAQFCFARLGGPTAEERRKEGD
ncbi:MAG: hypothetical protein ACOC8K_08530 [Gemmatimonadota bacterium]